MATRTNERPGVRAKLSDARFSACKAREVLDLVRGESVGDARNILELCDRGAAEPIAKLLDSAVANAGNNNDIPPEKLYVGACYADEGATLKRWRPRARGRATRINKRTCHITMIVSRYSAEEMDDRRARDERRGRSTDASAERARRVARSRAASEDDDTSVDDESTEAEIEEIEDEAMATAEGGTDEAVVEEAAEQAAEETAEIEADAEVDDSEGDDAGAEVTEEAEDDTAAVGQGPDVAEETGAVEDPGARRDDDEESN
ncbi:MAG: 50S ribosomal protein L22 [Microthrixaceae bacterium]